MDDRVLLNDQAQFAQEWVRDGDLMVLEHEVAPALMRTWEERGERLILHKHQFDGPATFEDMVVRVQIDKFDPDGELIGVARYGKPTFRDGLLVNTGGNYLMKALRESSVASGSQPDTTVKFNNALCHIGVGDSSTAAAVTQTDLQAAVNKLRKGMVTAFPKLVGDTYDRPNPTTGLTETITVGNREFVVSALFAGGDANFLWAELAIFNAVAAGLMLDRLILGVTPVFGGTKSASPQAVWQPTTTITAS